MLKSILTACKSLLYPQLCAGCTNEKLHDENFICITCWNTLPKTKFHLQTPNPIEKKFWNKVDIEFASALYYFNKDSHLQHILHALKYQKQKEIGELLGEKLALELSQSNWIHEIDAIIPVPLSKQKIKQRGFNQSESIAIGFQKILNIPILTNVIQRTKNTQSQTNKSISERHENVKDAFAIENKNEVEQKHILLIDDVLTTGATIEACAQTLVQNANCKVSVATVAYAIES